MLPIKLQYRTGGGVEVGDGMNVLLSGENIHIKYLSQENVLGEPKTRVHNSPHIIITLTITFWKLLVKSSVNLL